MKKIAALTITYDLGDGLQSVTHDLIEQSCKVETRDGLAYLHGVDSSVLPGNLPDDIIQELIRLLADDIGHRFIDNPPGLLHLRGKYIGPGPGPRHYSQPLSDQISWITIYLASPWPR